MDLRSGSSDLTVPSLIFMRMLQGKFLSHGKPPRIPLDSYLVGKASQIVPRNLDLGSIGAMRDQVTMLGGLGHPKNEEGFLPASLPPSHFSKSALWEEKKGRISLPNFFFCMFDLKRAINNKKRTSMDVLALLSLLSSVDLYWKSQLLVEYSKYLHIGMILDGMHQEDG